MSSTKFAGIASSFDVLIEREGVLPATRLKITSFSFLPKLQHSSRWFGSRRQRTKGMSSGRRCRLGHVGMCYSMDGVEVERRDGDV